MQEAFDSKQVTGRVNHTFLSLIPKVFDACSIDSFHPMSLCNCICKIISKVATNRLKKVIPDLIYYE